MDNYSLSDIAAVNNGGGFGGNSSWILIILFALIFGWNNNGYGRTDSFGQYATAASQQEILFGQQFQGLDNKIDRLGNGIADATFALNNSIKDGNSVVAGRVVDEGRALQSQLADCCCKQQANTDSVRYDMANFAAAINSNIDTKFASLEKSGLEQRIAEQAAQIQQLQLQSQLCGIVRYPMSNVYTSGNGPFCNCNCSCGNI